MKEEVKACIGQGKGVISVLAESFLLSNLEIFLKKIKTYFEVFFDIFSPSFLLFIKTCFFEKVLENLVA